MPLPRSCAAAAAVSPGAAGAAQAGAGAPAPVVTKAFLDIFALPENFFFYSASMVTLEASELFGELNSEELSGLRRIALERTFAPGQEIFKEGDAGDGVYLLREGAVEISGLVGENVRRVFSQVGPGEIFGEMAVIEDKPRSACAR